MLFPFAPLPTPGTRQLEKFPTPGPEGPAFPGGVPGGGGGMIRARIEPCIIPPGETPLYHLYREVTEQGIFWLLCPKPGM